MVSSSVTPGTGFLRILGCVTCPWLNALLARHLALGGFIKVWQRRLRGRIDEGWLRGIERWMLNEKCWDIAVKGRNKVVVARGIALLCNLK